MSWRSFVILPMIYVYIYNVTTLRCRLVVAMGHVNALPRPYWWRGSWIPVNGDGRGWFQKLGSSQDGLGMAKGCTFSACLFICLNSFSLISFRFLTKSFGIKFDSSVDVWAILTIFVMLFPCLVHRCIVFFFQILTLCLTWQQKTLTLMPCRFVHPASHYALFCSFYFCYFPGYAPPLFWGWHGFYIEMITCLG